MSILNSIMAAFRPSPSTSSLTILGWPLIPLEDNTISSAITAGWDKSIGWYEGYQLYEKTYPSGKHAWRYYSEEYNKWIYPHRRDVLLRGLRHDKKTPFVAQS